VDKLRVQVKREGCETRWRWRWIRKKIVNGVEDWDMHVYLDGCGVG
jgi:hypothetical protein